jgi:DNA-binding response OmpR family regulator
MRILVCEDHDSIRSMIEALVKARGFEVTGVNTGEKAIVLAIEQTFDVLLLDLMLPGGSDGFAVCERLRAEPRTHSLPIFVISAMDDSASRERAKSAGANAFYGKPFRPTELLKDLDRARSRLASKPDVSA